jgi:hypothetical protein
MRYIAGLPLLAAVLATATAPLGAQPESAITIAPVDGSEAVAVRGAAPAGAVIRITLVAAFSRDLPDVVLSRTTSTSDPNGTFAAIIPIAPAFERGTLVRAVASFPDGTTRTSAPYVVGPPRRASLPLDNLPASVR